MHSEMEKELNEDVGGIFLGFLRIYWRLCEQILSVGEYKMLNKSHVNYNRTGSYSTWEAHFYLYGGLCWVASTAREKSMPEMGLQSLGQGSRIRARNREGQAGSRCGVPKVGTKVWGEGGIRGGRFRMSWGCGEVWVRIPVLHGV